METAEKKILLLNGSPRREKSTTLLAANAFIEGMKDGGNYSVETVHVSSLRVLPCTGCLSCWGRTEGECVIRGDDVSAVKEKILASDIVIASFPLYYFEMPGQMKVLMDRLLSLVKAYHGQTAPTDGSPAHEFRYPLQDKKLVVVSGCAFTETDSVYEPLLRQLDLVFGKNGYQPLLLSQFKTMADNGGTRKERQLCRIRLAGREFAEIGYLKGKTRAEAEKPPFSRPVYQTVLDAVWRTEREQGEKDRLSLPQRDRNEKDRNKT